MVVRSTGLRLVYNLAYSPGGSLAMRREMDRDRDGQLSTGESRRGASALAERLAREVSLTVDGDRVPIHWAEPFVAPASGSVDPTPLTIELTAEVALPSGESQIAVQDVPILDGIDRTDVRFVAEPPAQLLASGSGRSPTDIEEIVSWLDRRAAGPRLVSMRVSLPGVRLRPWAVVGVGLALALPLGIATWIGWKRRAGNVSR